MENFDANTPSRDDERKSSVAEYLDRANLACNEGDVVLGLHLYMAAYEQSMDDAWNPSEEALVGIKKAWVIACDNEERGLAEYIFEKMQPFLTPDEITACAERLQSMALDGLQTLGISREEIEEMTRAISQSLMGVDAHVLKVEHIVKPNSGANAAAGLARKVAAEPSETLSGAPAAPSASNSCGGCSCGGDGKSAEADSAKALLDSINLGAGEPMVQLNYDNIAGYDSVIGIMRDYGIGMAGKEEFDALVKLLNARHGLDRMPAADTLLFRSPAREDASRFVVATLGELKLPALRMHMEENLQGMPLLCMTTQADNAPQLNQQRNAFIGGGVLILEDIDLWGAPLSEAAEGNNAQGGAPDLTAARMSRGAREAIALVRSAVENPDVYVLATASTMGEVDGFFLDLLEPLSLVDIELPTPEERIDIWMDIAREHPSMRAINRADLVRLSANMPRYDMYMAAREAIEEAYKLGLMTKHYRPVTRDIIFDKLAAYQPLDSPEYHELEETVVRDFRRGFADLERMLASE